MQKYCAYYDKKTPSIAYHVVNSLILYIYILGTIKYTLFIILTAVLLSNVLMMIHASLIIIQETWTVKKLIASDTIRNTDNCKTK